MVAHDKTLNKHYVLRGAEAMVVDLSKLDTISVKKYGEPLDDPECICGFEKTFSVVKLIEFVDPVRPVMDCTEQLSTRQLLLSRMVSFFFDTKSLTALVTRQEDPAELSCRVSQMRYRRRNRFWLVLIHMRGIV